MDLLTNSAWITPQLDYLLWLQNIRLHFGGAFDGLFLFFTNLGQFTIPTIIMCIIYWCVDSKSGLYLLSVNSFTIIFNQLFKLTACIYRPWVLNDKIIPVQATLKASGGYSFPSGHSAMASSWLGGVAFLIRKHKILSFFAVVVVLLVAFSRNYLGVHTPQDVIVGITTGFTMVFVINWLINYCEADKNRYLYSLLFVNVLIAAIILYICNKDYPAAYLNGKLLVSSDRAVFESVMQYGWFAGIINGGFLCRRFFPFDMDGVSIFRKIIRAVIGVSIIWFLMNYADNHFWGQVGNQTFAFVFMFLSGIFLTLLYPICFKFFKKS